MNQEPKNPASYATDDQVSADQDVIARIRKGLAEVQQGLGRDFEEVFAELENEC